MTKRSTQNLQSKSSALGNAAQDSSPQDSSELVSSAATSQIVVGLVALLVGMFLTFGEPALEVKSNFKELAGAGLFLVLWVGSAMALWGLVVLKVHRQASTGLLTVPSDLDGFAKSRIWRKWLGLMLTYAVLSLVYWILPIYRQDFYKTFFVAVNDLLPTLVVFSWFYIRWIDRRQSRQEQLQDPCYLLGQWFLDIVTGRRGSRGGQGLRLWSAQKLLNPPLWLANYSRAWLVKAFFIPLMFGFLCESISAIAGWKFNFLELNWVRQVEVLSDGIFFVDLLWGCVGYVWSLRLLDSHIRSTEPTVLGWLVALTFYAPFNSVLGPNYFAYETSMKWHNWLSGTPFALYAWGAAILLLNLVFVWATVVFGLKFSNLTYRGVITSGPYRWFKHPAYICKNLSWWLIAMPFMVSTTPAEALRMCLILILANLGYYFRAKTEERHLLQVSPEYGAYCLAMSAKGFWGKFTK